MAAVQTPLENASNFNGPQPQPLPQPQPMQPEAPPAQLPVIGIIYPPPEVRNIVDKTAGFVASYGPEFESRIRENKLGNPKFNFLSPGDPYNAYYQHKVKEFREAQAAGQEQAAANQAQAPARKSMPTATLQKQQELLKQAVAEQPFIPKDPPPEFEFIADPPSISAQDLDIVRMTAQFVARNGRQFLTSLMNREQRNCQFDFLRPQHSLFQYFTKLLEQYTKILVPPKDIVPKLEEESYSIKNILEKVKYRADWQQYQEAQKRKAEQQIEKERVAYAQIDWHDFVVVETVDYQIGEVGNFPTPTTPSEVGARVLMQERIEENGGEAGENEDGDDDEEEEEEDEEENEMQMGSDDEMEDRTHEKPTKQKERANSSESEGEEESNEAKDARDNTQVQDMEEDSSSEDEDREKSEDRRKSGPPIPDALQPPLPPQPDKVIVKKGYDPKQAQKAAKTAPADEYLISPITGEKIPASQVQKHMRIGLLDRSWIEQRDKHIQEKRNQETVFAPGSAIEDSLKELAERRTDIFGVGDEETVIGKKIGEEDTKKDDKVTWDGHTSSVEAATRAARANITIEEQIHQIHKVKGLLPDEEKEKIGPKPAFPGGRHQPQHPQSAPMPPPPATTAPAPPPPAPAPVKHNPPPPQMPVLAPPPPLPTLTPMPPNMSGMMMMPQQLQPPPMMVPAVPRPPHFQVVTPGPPMPPAFIPAPPIVQQPQQAPTKHAAEPNPEDEPPSKKVRTEESLIPEHQFMANHPSPVNFSVSVPTMNDKPEWKLNGQTIQMSLPLQDSVAVIKAKLHDATGMPPGKQKIHMDGLFFKDSNSLAYYNVTPGTVLQLQLKERGGRKR
ncbi:unnamed protein product [Bemisia tabaci]|uniref:Splicing factor 3A subunit 1 n=1 Tax=Bemisia tabaci TaxID=7038 RepID=A0A9P0ANG2_BEMTA|nr:unnamed protein product [Bemisia tabaci]